MMQRRKNHSPESGKRIYLGVTGHRMLSRAAEIQISVRAILKRIRNTIGDDVHITILSPLAEGADRLVVREAVTAFSLDLEVVLPLPVEEYLYDFTSEQSRDEFRMLLAKAEGIVSLPPKILRPEAYEAAGRYVAAHCDILLALWDGMNARGRGGTAAIVSFSRELKKPLIWINTEQPERVFEERTEGILGKANGISLKMP